MKTHSTTITSTVPSNPYIKNTPAPPPTTVTNTLNTFGHKLNSATKKAETFAGDLFNHFRTGPGLINVAKARFNQAARFVVEGGSDHIFRREFGHIPGENFKKAHPCYLSMTGGPILGILYISNLRVAFKSDDPVWTGPGCGPGQWVYYKVDIGLNRINTVNPVSNNQSHLMEKYVEMVTKDGYEFWFLGFISYEKALNSFYEALENCHKLIDVC